MANQRKVRSMVVRCFFPSGPEHSEQNTHELTDETGCQRIRCNIVGPDTGRSRFIHSGSQRFQPPVRRPKTAATILITALPDG